MAEHTLTITLPDDLIGKLADYQAKNYQHHVTLSEVMSQALTLWLDLKELDLKHPA